MSDKIQDYANAIYEYLVDNELFDYEKYDYDDFAKDLDMAIKTGRIMEIPELDREEAFETAIDIMNSGDEPDESMDGDFDSGMASAGFGTDEDYGDFGDNDFFGESIARDSDYIIKMLKESLASKKAKKLGLVHIGFGNYAEESGAPAQYKTVDGKLKKIGGKAPKKQKAIQTSDKAHKEKDEKKKKEKPKEGIRNLRRVSGEKFTYEAEVNGRNMRFTLNKQERKELKGEGSILDILKKRLKKKSEKQKSKQFKKGQHVTTNNTK